MHCYHFLFLIEVDSCYVWRGILILLFIFIVLWKFLTCFQDTLSFSYLFDFIWYVCCVWIFYCYVSICQHHRHVIAPLVTIDYHSYLNLISKDLYLRFGGVLSHSTFSIGNLTSKLKLGFQRHFFPNKESFLRFYFLFYFPFKK